MAFQDPQSGDIHATLAVSQEEARFGSRRVVNLPDGRSTTVMVPAGTYNGQELRLAGQGSMSGARGRSGDLILRVAVVTDDGGTHAGDNFATERAIYVSPSDFSLPGTGSNPGWTAPASSVPGAPMAAGPGAGSSPNLARP